MNWIHRRSAALFILCTAVTLPSFSNVPNRIIGLEKAVHFHKHTQGKLYIQAAAFTNRQNAVNYLHTLKKKLHEPVVMHQSAQYFHVIIGPLSSAEQVRKAAGEALNRHLIAEKKPRNQRPINLVEKHLNVDKDHLPEKTARPQGILLSVEGGVYQGKSDAMTVGNGSGFPAPANRDIYTGKSNNPGSAGISAGVLRNTNNPWLPSYFLGLRYKFLSTKNNGQVIQYSTPKYTNYDYQWKINSNIILAQGKLNLRRFSRFLPYINGGVGLALNRSQGYAETALNGITPRISPAFGGRTQSQFTYAFGAGLDYQINRKAFLSVGYEFQNFGKFSSGNGISTWASESLGQSNFHANALIFSVNYLM